MTRSGGAPGLMALALSFFLGVSFDAWSQGPTKEAAARIRALASEGSPQLGTPGAKVHVVEFLDPACEACAAAYPEIKRIMAKHPGRVRLSVRHVPFHRGAQPVVRMLEAARAQGKYEQALEALLLTQGIWTQNHTAIPDRAIGLLRQAGLDEGRLRTDMESPEIARRVTADLDAARLLKVTRTPELFVNGKGMEQPSIGAFEALVDAAVAAEYGAAKK